MSILALSFASGENSLAVRRFAITEEMSAPFCVAIVAVSPNKDLDLESLLGQPAFFHVTSGIKYAFSSGRSFSGICRSIKQIRSEDGASSLSTYELEIVPSLWLLTQRVNSRVFQRESIPDIVHRLLSEWDITPVWRLDRARYPKLDLRIQYEESDHDFCSRLLEEAGIAYFFEDDPEKGSQLVFCDSFHEKDRSDERRRPLPIPFVDTTSQIEAAELEFVTSVRLHEEVRPGRWTIRDHDFRRPVYPLFGETPLLSDPESAYEQYQYLPGSFLVTATTGAEASRTSQALAQAMSTGGTPVADDKGTARFDDEAGSALARRSLEAVRTGRRRVSFTTNAIDLSPGTTLAIGGYPRTDLTMSDTLLVTAFRFEGTATGSWTIHVDTVFAADPYRPRRKTKKPRICGRQSAVVVGPKGEEIHTDEFGRVRVQFFWDREGKLDENSSIWIRVSQGWAGTGYGMIMLPRIGHEVLVAFLDGDPDSPVIVGRVFNGSAQVPYSLPENKTVSTWKSDSSPGSGGYNEIKFEDKKGKELIYVQAERDYAQWVKNNEMSLVGNDRTIVVEHDEISSIKRNRTVMVHRDESASIGQDRTEQIKGSASISIGRNRSTFVRGEERETAAADRTTEIGLLRHATIGAEDTRFVGNRYSVTIAQGNWGKLARGLHEMMEEGVLGNLLGRAAPLLEGLLPMAWEGALGQRLHELDPKELLESAEKSVASAMSSVLPEPFKRLLSLASVRKEPSQVGLPTSIQMVEGEITLTTGQATVILNGPDLALIADGEIWLHAGGRLSLISTEDRLVAQGGPGVHFNSRHEESPKKPSDRSDRTDRSALREAEAPSPLTVVFDETSGAPTSIGLVGEVGEPKRFPLEALENLLPGVSVFKAKGHLPTELVSALGASKITLPGGGVLSKGPGGDAPWMLLSTSAPLGEESESMPGRAPGGHVDELLSAYQKKGLAAASEIFGQIAERDRTEMLAGLLSADSVASFSLYLNLVKLPIGGAAFPGKLFDPSRIPTPSLEQKLVDDKTPRPLPEWAMMAWEYFQRLTSDTSNGVIPLDQLPASILTQKFREHYNGSRLLRSELLEALHRIVVEHQLPSLIPAAWFAHRSRQALFDRTLRALGANQATLKKLEALMSRAASVIHGDGFAIFDHGEGPEEEDAPSLLRLLTLDRETLSPFKILETISKNNPFTALMGQSPQKIATPSVDE